MQGKQESSWEPRIAATAAFKTAVDSKQHELSAHLDPAK